MLRIPFVLFFNAFHLSRHLLRSLGYGMRKRFFKQKRYARLVLAPSYGMSEGAGWQRWFGSDRTTMLQLLRELEQLRTDPDLDGIVIRIDRPLTSGPARLEVIGRAIAALRDAGKQVVLHADSLSTLEYALASQASRVLVAPAGRLYTFGPRFEEFFAAPLLERLGIRAEFLHIGSFKTAGNRFVHAEAPDAQRGMMDELLVRLRQRWLEPVVEGRGLREADAERLFADAPYDARDAVRRGLIDAEAFASDLGRELVAPDHHVHLGETSPDPTCTLLDWGEALRQRPVLHLRPLVRPPRVAILDLSGVITMGSETGVGSRSGPLAASDVIPVLEAIANDRSIQGVLLHINSPGGSALASDLIWKAIEDVRAQKPVVAYCSDVAASGGYYMAVAADRIIAHRQSIVGSIGVIMGKFSLGEPLERLGVRMHATRLDPSSSFLSPFEGLDPHTVDRLRGDIRTFYRRFLQRVGMARRLHRRRLHRYARGRVYFGDDALRRGLIDGTGGLEQALLELATLLDTRPDRLDVRFRAHRREPLLPGLARAGALSFGALPREVVEPIAGWAETLHQLRREPFMAIWPYRLRP